MQTLIIAGLILVALAALTVIAEKITRSNLPIQHIDPDDLMDAEPCSWCQKEKAIVAQPHESHSICARHAAELLEQKKTISKLKHQTQ